MRVFTNALSQRGAILSLIIGCVVFGLGSIIVATVSVGGYAIAFWRLVVAGVIFFVLARCAGQRLPKNRKAVGLALLAGACLAYDLAFWHESIYAVGPGISTLLNSLQIFFLALLGFVLFGERQTRWQIASLLLAIVGVAMIGSPELQHNRQAVWGFVSGILSGAMLAGSMALIRQTHTVETTPILPLMLLLSVGGAVSMLPAMWLVETGPLLPMTWRDVGLVLMYGAVMQCFAWGLIAYSIPRLSLALTGLLLLTEPVAALLIDYFFLHKAIILVQWLGAGVTLFAIYLGSAVGTLAESDA